jgi:hypothetical protein
MAVLRRARRHDGARAQRVILFATVRAEVLVVRPVAPETGQAFAFERDATAAMSAPDVQDDEWDRSHALPILRAQEQRTLSSFGHRRCRFENIFRNAPGVRWCCMREHIDPTSGESARNVAEETRRLAEDRRQVREQRREALERARQEREHLRAAAELARTAGEEARLAAEAARHAAMEAVRATADTLKATLEHMEVVERLRRTLREATDAGKPDLN